MQALDDYEVLPGHSVPVRYSGVSDGALELSGDDETLSESTTADDPVVGSGPELGGVPADARTSDGSDLSEADVVNLTGMSESPQVAEAIGPNINGSGADTQQLPSRTREPGAASLRQALSYAMNEGSGTSLAIASQAPKSLPGTSTLTQTKETGLSKGAMMVL